MRLPISHTFVKVYSEYEQALVGLLEECSTMEDKDETTWRLVVKKGKASFSYFLRMTTKKGSDFCDKCTEYKTRDYQPFHGYVEHRELANNERRYYMK